MKTLEQILERFKNNIYDDHAISYLIGYCEAKGFNMDDAEFRNPEPTDSIDGFLEWFEKEDLETNNKEKCTCDFKIADGLLASNKGCFVPVCKYIFLNGIPLIELWGATSFAKNEEEKKLIYKIQVEERAILNKELYYKKEVLTNLERMATYHSDKNILVAIENLKKEIDEISGKLQEVINEK